MDAIHLTAKVGDDHRIVVDLPPDVEIGSEVDLTIRPHHAMTRDEARAIWKARGWLKEPFGEVPDNYVPLSDDEILQLTAHLKGTFSLDDMIDEDRGPY